MIPIIVEGRRRIAYREHEIQAMTTRHLDLKVDFGEVELRRHLAPQTMPAQLRRPQRVDARTRQQLKHTLRPPTVIRGQDEGLLHPVQPKAVKRPRAPRRRQRTRQQTLLNPLRLLLFRDRVGSTHSSLPANVFAAFYGLLPDDACKRAVIALIREKRLAFALLFVPFPMLSFLLHEGEEALVHDLLTDPTTWRNILAEGGTRTFEGWRKDATWNTSLFHLTLSLAAAFLTD